MMLRISDRDHDVKTSRQGWLLNMWWGRTGKYVVFEPLFVWPILFGFKIARKTTNWLIIFLLLTVIPFLSLIIPPF